MTDPAYGATGDGTTDDTAAIQAAIDDTTNDTIYLPKPAVYYRITAALVLRSNITIVGDGRENTIIHQDTNSAHGFTYATGSGAHRVTFKNFQIQANGSTTNTGFAFSMRSTVPAYYFRHRWTNVLVEDFGGAYDVNQSVLATWVNCQIFRVNKGWNLDQVDTPILIGCGINGTANDALYGVKATNGTLSGTILNGEWGSTQRVFDFQSGYWNVTGSNIETNTKDGIIKVSGSGTRASFTNVKILTGGAEASNQAVVLIDASTTPAPHVEWNNGHIDKVSGAGSWRDFVIRGTYYYLSNPIINAVQGSFLIYMEESSGGTQRGSYLTTMPIPSWHATNVTSVGNTSSGNSSRRRYLFQRLAHNSETGFGDDLTYIYKHRNGGYYQTQLGNDDLEMVWRTPNDEIATVGTTETTFVENNFSSYTLKEDGMQIKCVTAGEFGSTAFIKTLKVYFGNSTWTKAVTHNAKEYELTATITKRGTSSAIVRLKLEVDGVLTVIEKMENTQSNLSGTRLFKITGTGVADDDILAHHSRLTWHRNESDYHQTP